MMTEYVTTRAFPAELAGRVDNLIPRCCRSVRMSHEDDGTCTLTAHRSEIAAARRAIRIARDEAATAHIR
jgi:hypothetical protein